MRDINTHNETTHPGFLAVGFAFCALLMVAFIYLTPTPMESAIEAEPQATSIPMFMPKLKPAVFDTVVSHHIDAGGHAYRVNDTCSADQLGVIEAGINLATGDVAEACLAYDDVE